MISGTSAVAPVIAISLLFSCLPSHVHAQDQAMSEYVSPRKDALPIWTLRPVSIDRNTEVRERLPPRGRPDGARRLLVDRFPRIDGDATFMAEGRRWRIAHVDLPERSFSCPFDHGRRWPCGVRAWAYVSGLLAGIRLDCDPPLPAEEAVPTIDCRLEDVSIAERILRAGWGKPRPGAPGTLIDVYQHAVQAGRGIHGSRPPP